MMYCWGLKMPSNRECPACSALGRDSTGDHLFLLEDGETWACFKEWHPPYFEKVGNGGEKIVKESLTTGMRVVATPTKDAEDTGGGTYMETVDNIRKLPNSKDDSRCTTEDDSKYFGIRYLFNERDGSIDKIYYPYTKGGKLCGYKVRSKYGETDRAVLKGKVKAGTLKKFYTLGDMAGIDLFGQARIQGHKKLVLTEGEEDIKAVRSMIEGKYGDMKVDYLSLPTGVSLLKGGGASLVDVIPHKAVFDKAEEVYLLMDEDKAGKAMLKSLSQFLGDKALVVSLPEKDASDMKKKGREADFYKAFFSAKGYKPDFVVEIDDILEEAVAEVEWGLSYPFSSLTNMMYGAMLKEITGIGAGPGAGKTVFIQQIIRHLIKEHNAKCCIIDCEDIASKTLKKVIGSAMGKQIHLPSCAYDKDEAREIGLSFKDHLYIYNHEGRLKEWVDIVNAIRYYYQQGVTYFFLDPLSALTTHLTASEANEYLNVAMSDMMGLVQELDMSIYHVNHLNSPSGDKDHGEGAKVRAGQFAGSRSMWRFSHNLLGLERNQQEEDDSKKNRVTVRILKNRIDGSKTGTFQLNYNTESGQLEEPTINMGGLV